MILIDDVKILGWFSKNSGKEHVYGISKKRNMYTVTDPVSLCIRYNLSKNSKQCPFADYPKKGNGCKDCLRLLKKYRAIEVCKEYLKRFGITARIWSKK